MVWIWGWGEWEWEWDGERGLGESWVGGVESCRFMGVGLRDGVGLIGV